MRIGVLGAADIAFRRFLPALQKCAGFTYAGVASRTPKKGEPFQKTFGGEIYDGYDALLADENIDAVYVPLPPALHSEWGKKVLDAGKHLIMEKPCTTSLSETEELLSFAAEKGLAVHENYMFLYHSQLAKIKELIASDDTIGSIRLYRMTFGFPKRAEGDFRYNKALGGGALLDCGGYPIRLALDLLGESAKVTQATLVHPPEYEVDLYGNAVLENDKGQCAQIAFGMDNSYQCQLEAWGNNAQLIASRIFTAGPDYQPQVVLYGSSGKEKVLTLEADDQFLHSIEMFQREIEDAAVRKKGYMPIMQQAKLQDMVFQMGGKNESY